MATVRSSSRQRLTAIAAFSSTGLSSKGGKPRCTACDSVPLHKAKVPPFEPVAFEPKWR